MHAGAELPSCDRHHMAHEDKNIYFPALHRKSLTTPRPHDATLSPCPDLTPSESGAAVQADPACGPGRAVFPVSALDLGGAFRLLR